MSAENLKAQAVHRQMQNACADIWLQLNQTDLKSLAGHVLSDGKQTFSSALQYFTDHDHAKIISLRALTKADKKYLASRGISTKHLVRNLIETMGRNYRDPWAFQLDAVRRKAIYAFCPFSGKLALSTHSFLANINTIFYRFQSEQVYYIAVAGIGWGFEKKAVYIPEHELVVTTGDPWSLEEADLIELKARMTSEFTLCYEYLTDRHHKRINTVVCFGYWHFAHHLWNELSGINRLFRSKLLDSVDKFLVMREPLGNFEEIFPEVPSNKIQRIHNTSDMFTEILLHRYFAIKVGQKFITRDLQNRVYKVALGHSLPATREKISAARKKHYPLLWVGIRTGNRSWADQATGLAKVIKSLHKEFPRLGVVFDGFSFPADRSGQSLGSQEYVNITKQENAVVDEIIQKLKDDQNVIETFNIIGSSLFDANIWAHAVDLYVSPFGTLQHKVGWLANKPGIIHANQSLLGNFYRNYVWTTVEDAYAPKFVRRSSVVNVDNTRLKLILYSSMYDRTEAGAGINETNKRLKLGQEFFNYQVEWSSLYFDILDMIKSPRSIITTEALTYKLIFKLRNSLRILTNIFASPGLATRTHNGGRSNRPHER
jgi:hypothetical protein